MKNTAHNFTDKSFTHISRLHSLLTDSQSIDWLKVPGVPEYKEEALDFVFAAWLDLGFSIEFLLKKGYRLKMDTAKLDRLHDEIEEAWENYNVLDVLRVLLAHKETIYLYPTLSPEIAKLEIMAGKMLEKLTENPYAITTVQERAVMVPLF